MTGKSKPSPAQQVFGGLFILVVGSVAVFFMGQSAYDVWRLANEGQEVSATVVSYKPQPCGKNNRSTCAFHLLQAEGKDFFLDLHGKVDVGTVVPVTYLPSDITVARRGRAESEPWLYLKRELTETDAFLAFFVLAWLLTCLQTIVRGAMRMVAAPQAAMPAAVVPSSPTAPIALPKGVEMTRDGGQLHLVRRWVPWPTTVITGCFLAFFFYQPVMSVVLHGNLVPLIFLVFTLPFLYVFAVMVLNRTHLTVGYGKLVITSKPVPLPKIPGWVPSLSLEGAKVKQIYAKEVRGSKGSISYELCAKLDGAEDVRLMSSMGDLAQARFIEQEVEKFLNIRNVAVAGEVVPG
jgi:hypothetical protein